MPAAPRAYRSPRREAQARATRRRVLRSATARFTEAGWSGTTMAAVAAGAGVSRATVEALFGSKGRLLKAAIDVAIAGDDEPVPVLDRDWARLAEKAEDVAGVAAAAAGVLGPAQSRSAGLVLTVFEGARVHPELATLAAAMTAQRAATAAWIVERVVALGALRHGIDRDQAVDVVFALMEPALFDRLTRWRGWTVPSYERWFARTLCRLLEQGDTT